MKKYVCLLLVLFITEVFAQNAPVYPAFIRGLNTDVINACQAKVLPLCNKNDIEHYQNCLRSFMQTEDLCSQNLALLRLSTEAVTFTKIIQNQFLFVVEATITEPRKKLPADPPNTPPYKETPWYFIVDNKGEFIDTNTTLTDLQNSTMYHQFIRKYPNATVQKITPEFFPPSFENLPQHSFRVTFSRKVTDGCKTCQEIGITTQGYDFDRNGNFKWVKFLKLIPSENFF